MSTTPGYGETPAGSSPEQPDWLRKRSDAASSGSDGAPRYDTGSAPGASPAAPSDSDGQRSPFPGTQQAPSPYAGPAQHPGQSPYPAPPQYPGQLQHQAPPQHPGQPQYPASPQYQAQYPASPQYQAQPQYQPQYQAQPPYPGPYPSPGAPGTPWAPVDPQAKSRLAAGLLGIFLGALGIHRFYLGYTRIGMVMLLMTLLSFGLLSVITSVWGLVEGILYLTDKTGRYSHDATGRPLRD